MDLPRKLTKLTKASEILMIGFFLKAALFGLIIASVAQFAPRMPYLGALILSLPLVSMGALIFTWLENRDIKTISNLSGETLILVPLGLIFFVPLALAERMGTGFWTSFTIGVCLSALLLTLWLFWKAT